ncbi:MAG: hypothetical protein ACK5GN_11210 [Pseudomonadota bacterium]
MIKTLPNLPELTEEELATEIIELTTDQVNSLTQAFEMISQLCDQLQIDVLAESLSQIPDKQVH